MFLILQIASLACIPIILIVVAGYLRIFTINYFMPFDEFLMSFKIAFPPIAMVAITYIVAFLAGVQISHVPATILAFFRNRFFQSSKLMSCGIIFTLAFAGVLVGLHAQMTPPAYDKVVSGILGGENDDFHVSKRNIDRVKSVDFSSYEKLKMISAIFEERSNINKGKSNLTTARYQIFIRNLEAEKSSHWQNHPLRLHALAEAYSLYAQSAKITENSKLSRDLFGSRRNSDQLFQESIKLYAKVANTSNGLAPPLLVHSALHNIGNQYYYMGDVENAVKSWGKANSPKLGGKRNLSSWGNVIAGLVVSKKYRDAVLESERARNWADANGKVFTESFNYASILENAAFAKFNLGDNADALRDSASSIALRNDELSKQNYAVFLALSGYRAEAIRVLRQLSSPAIADNLAHIVKKPQAARCVYLLWGLINSDLKLGERLANLLAFLGEIHSRPEIDQMDKKSIDGLVARVRASLPNAAEPCSTLPLINGFDKLFDNFGT